VAIDVPVMMNALEDVVGRVLTRCFSTHPLPYKRIFEFIRGCQAPDSAGFGLSADIVDMPLKQNLKSSRYYGSDIEG